VIEEMAGSDRVPDPNDSKRARVGNAQTIYESEMALSHECLQKYARKLLDTADIVRDGDLSLTMRDDEFRVPRDSRAILAVSMNEPGPELTVHEKDAGTSRRSVQATTPAVLLPSVSYRSLSEK
jgi:hypothetical protein